MSHSIELFGVSGCGEGRSFTTGTRGATTAAPTVPAAAAATPQKEASERERSWADTKAAGPTTLELRCCRVCCFRNSGIQWNGAHPPHWNVPRAPAAADSHQTETQKFEKVVACQRPRLRPAAQSGSVELPSQFPHDPRSPASPTASSTASSTVSSTASSAATTSSAAASAAAHPTEGPSAAGREEGTQQQQLDQTFNQRRGGSKDRFTSQWGPFEFPCGFDDHRRCQPSIRPQGAIN